MTYVQAYTSSKENIMNLVGNKWDEILKEEYQKEYFKKIVIYINKEYKERPIFPPKSHILRALSRTICLSSSSSRPRESR